MYSIDVWTYIRLRIGFIECHNSRLLIETDRQCGPTEGLFSEHWKHEIVDFQFDYTTT
jgi:hypothetical protein